MNKTHMTQYWEEWATNYFLYLVQTLVVVYLSPSTRMSGQQPLIGYSFPIHSHLVSFDDLFIYLFIYSFIYLLAIRKNVGPVAQSV
jgi:hypothetical protein